MPRMELKEITVPNICGALISLGNRRGVFVYAHDDKYVVKVAKKGEESHNQREAENYKSYKDLGIAEYFAPCSLRGDALIMRRATKTTQTVEMPDFIRDLTPYNVGMVGHVPVCIDYEKGIDFEKLKEWKNKKTFSIIEPIEVAKKIYKEDLKNKVVEMIQSSSCAYNTNVAKPYQSLPRLGIVGVRKTEERIELYKVARFCKDMDVVVIGSNLGFLDIEMSPYCKTILSLEKEPTVSEIESFIVKKLGITNITTQVCDFPKDRPRDKYDVVVSTAVHRYMKMSFEDLILTYRGMLRDEKTSKILIESHKFSPGSKQDSKGHEEYQELCKALSKQFTEVYKGQTYSPDYNKPNRVRLFSWWGLKTN